MFIVDVPSYLIIHIEIGATLNTGSMETHATT